MDFKNLGEFLLWHRTAQNLTQKEFAEKAGLSVPTYCGIENGRTKHRISNVTVRKLAEATKRSVKCISLLAHR